MASALQRQMDACGITAADILRMVQVEPMAEPVPYFVGAGNVHQGRRGVLVGVLHLRATPGSATVLMRMSDTHKVEAFADMQVFPDLEAKRTKTADLA